MEGSPLFRSIPERQLDLDFFAPFCELWRCPSTNSGNTPEGEEFPADARARTQFMEAMVYNSLIMPRISRLEKDQVDPETGKIYDVYLQERGNVPNMFCTVAHRPEIFRTMIAHFRAVMNTGTVPAKLKELVIVRTSQINQCEY
jgi:hypothetical protein